MPALGAGLDGQEESGIPSQGVLCWASTVVCYSENTNGIGSRHVSIIYGLSIRSEFTWQNKQCSWLDTSYHVPVTSKVV